jgi:uncharacterized repeat protein (TIGR01451 family)
VNTAEVDGPHEDPDTDNNTSISDEEIGTSADLAIAKSHVGDLVPGESGTYTITVVNHGPSVAAGPITVVDELPAGLTYSSDDGAGWSCTPSGSTVECERAASMEVDEETSFDLIVDIASSADSGFVNEASVDSSTPDPVPGNNTAEDSTEIEQRSDLAITKAHDGEPVVAGTDVEFELEVTNNGPSDSPGPIIVVDTLPEGLEYVSADDASDDWDCTHEDGVITCELADGLDDGQSSSLDVVARVLPSVTSSVVNSAAVSGPAIDDDPSNDTATDSVDVITRADLSLTKEHTGDDEVVAGTSTSFDLVVTNDGPSDAAAPVRVVDTLPSGTTFAGFSGSGWSCDAVGLVVTCEHEDLLPAGEEAPTLTLDVDVASGTLDATLTNDAVVSSPTVDPDPDNNDATADVDVVTRADLALTKSHGAGPHTAGSVVEYTFEVENAGPSDAAAPLEIVDELPDGFSFVSVGAASSWTCSVTDEIVTCELDEGLLAGTSAQDLTLTLLTDASLPADTYRNTASVTSGTEDPDTENNVATDDLELTTSADLAVTKTLVGTAVIGERATYVVQVENLGTSVATEPVTVTDELPTGLTYVSGSGADWSCAEDAGLVTCELDGDLAVGAAPALSLEVEVGPAAYPSVTNTAVVSSGTEDPEPANDSSSVTTPIAPLVDLSITKTHAGAFAVGSIGSYDITVANAGPTDDPGPIVITDALPSGLTYRTASGDGWTCTAAGAIVTCTSAGGLPIGSEASVRIDAEVLPSAAPGVVNTATVSGADAEVDLSNNTASDPTVVTPVVDLSLTKTLVGSIVAGGEATYRLVVANDGPSPTSGDVVVSDRLPSGLTFVSATGTGWECGDRGQLVTCTSSAVVAAGKSAPPITIVTSVSAAAGADVRNSASVSTGMDDLDTDNDASTADAVVADGEAGGNLPATGGIALNLIAFGLLSLLVGALALRLGRRATSD